MVSTGNIIYLVFWAWDPEFSKVYNIQLMLLGIASFELRTLFDISQ